jgi:hypothetical protein
MAPRTARLRMDRKGHPKVALRESMPLSEVIPMLGIKLVRLIEKHSENIAEGLTTRLRTSERTQAYCKLPEEELRVAGISLYAHLEEWLLTKTESDVERYFRDVGSRRATEGIPSSQMAWALMMSKTQLWAFVYREAAAEKALELYSELEFLETLDRFFDRAVYYALVGHEQNARVTKAA